MSAPILWTRFQQHLSSVPDLELTLDVSRMQFDDGFLYRMAGPMERSFEAMATEKLAEGIRNFYADARKLEQYARTRVTQKMAS